MHDILDIIKNIDTVYTTNSSLSILKDLERVLDEIDLYVYKNWLDGELASGPVAEKHWVKASFMWPKDKMPDPIGAKRLLDYGCKVRYEKSHLVEPRKVKSEQDMVPNTKKAKLDRKPIWIVEISMPRKLVSDIYQGYMSKMKENLGIGRAEGTTPTPTNPADTAAIQQTPAVPSPAMQQPIGAVPNV